MKAKWIISWFSVLLLAACETLETVGLDVEMPGGLEQAVGHEGKTLSLEIKSGGAWRVASDVVWCTPVPSEGVGDATVALQVGANIDEHGRTATVTCSASAASPETVVIRQEASPDDAEEYHYRLPIIFHVLYADESDSRQYVDKEGWLAYLVELCNRRFADAYEAARIEGKAGADLNVEFVMAETDPEGRVLDEPGVERRYWREATMDCDAFTSERDAERASLVWDLNRYVNVFLYTFSDANVLGITHLPYASSANPLAGLTEGDYFYATNKVDYPRGVSINNRAIYDLSEEGTFLASDIVTTLCHELGHYLGLFHAFSSGDASDTEAQETDYCDDTPDYDRAVYLAWLRELTAQKQTAGEELTMNEAVRRVATDGKEFNAHNIMDYYWTLADEFTPDQRKRVRHVLENSPLIPGPKYEQPVTRSGGDLREPPVRTLKLERISSGGSEIVRK